VRNHNKYAMAHPTLLQRIANKIKYRAHFKNMALVPKLNHEQETILTSLRNDGFVILPEYLNQEVLSSLQYDFQQSLENLQFETPCLAQSKINQKKHSDFINNYMLGTPEFIESIGAAFNHNECQSYKQVISDFNPSTLTLKMLQYSQTFRETWLDPSLLSIISHYMGLVPQLAEAYVRRNFPAPYRSMNHYWHRDLNNRSYLLKMFVFLNDCTVENGPHEYIKGSCTESTKIATLNGKRYYTNDEVNKLYPQHSDDRVLSLVKAGTVVIEDTRGVHRANLPESGHRDLGFAVFTPTLEHAKPLYSFPEQTYNSLHPFQKIIIPNKCIQKEK